MGCFPSNPKKPSSSPEALEPEPIIPAQSTVPVPMELERPSLVVRTNFSRSEVIALDRTPDSTSRQGLRYTCPVCLKFLSTILVSACCQNYLCHFCVEAMQRAREDMRCPMCTAEPLVLSDVEAGAPVKKYSDSPYSTVGAGKSSRTQGQKWLAPMEIVEEDMKLGLDAGEADQPSIPLSERPPVQAAEPSHPAMTH